MKRCPKCEQSKPIAKPSLQDAADAYAKHHFEFECEAGQSDMRAAFIAGAKEADKLNGHRKTEGA